MEETIESFLNKEKEELQKALEHLAHELSKIRAGKANTSLVSEILVPYYGNPTPMNQVANISTPDSKTISIQPWEKKMLGEIERAIFQSNLGITPMNDGEFIRISMPPLTEERRIILVKQSKGLGEDAKVSIRSIRHKLLDFIKKEVKEGFPEDAGKRREAEVESLKTEYYDRVDKMIDAKEVDIMTV
jgi:ribosome recycling factor